MSKPGVFARASSQPENPFAALIRRQAIAIVPAFTLESGVVLRNVPVAFTTRGTLSAAGDNAMVICHALTGSADVSDWWGPLLGGPGKAFDTTRFYVVCINSLGSPYGTASPVTNRDGDPALGRYGPEFPLTTVRDDVALHKRILDDLGVRQIAVAIGGSMGGMLVLEWAFYGPEYVRSIIPIATSSRHSAWGISWGEAQRQSIYSDPKYADGYYSFDDPPVTGLGAARMTALLTYRSRDSFESRFGRNTPDPSRRQTINGENNNSRTTTNTATTTAAGHHVQSHSSEHWVQHNEGHKRRAALPPTGSKDGAVNGGGIVATSDARNTNTNANANGHRASTAPPPRPAPTYFSAQSYLRYQGEKFVRRFDSNCYIAITRKLDTHDLCRPRSQATPNASASASASANANATPLPVPTTMAAALAQIQQPTLVIGIQSDGLFTFAEQQELAAGIRHARLRTIDSPDGHDAFLLQFEQVNGHILDFLADQLPDLMRAPALPQGLEREMHGESGASVMSLVGEADGDDEESDGPRRVLARAETDVDVDVDVDVDGNGNGNGDGVAVGAAGKDQRKQRGDIAHASDVKVEDITAW